MTSVLVIGDTHFHSWDSDIHPSLMTLLSEADIAVLQQHMTQPDFFAQPKDQIVAAKQQLTELEDQLQNNYGLWESLEQKNQKP